MISKFFFVLLALQCVPTEAWTRVLSRQRCLMKANNIETDVLIVGAGISGLALGYDLSRRGIDYMIVEKASSPREGGTAIGLWTNAWRCLDNMGLADALRKSYLGGEKLCIGTAKAGKKLVEFDLSECDGGPHEFRYVMRSELLKLLLMKIPSKRLMYKAPFVNVRDEAGEPVIAEFQGGKTISCKVLVGADGVGSVVFRRLFPTVAPATYAGYKAIRGVARFSSKNKLDELVASSKLPFKRGIIHQIWGEGVRLGTFRITDKTLYWFVTYNGPKGGDTAERDGGRALLRRAQETMNGWNACWGIDAILEATSPEDVLLTSIGDRLPKPLGNWAKGRITLIGDSAHPSTPNLGQGGAAGIEDALVLGEFLQNHFRSETGDVAKVLRNFEKERGPRTTKLTLKAGIFGFLLQIPYLPVTFVRDNIALPLIFKPKSFLEHTKYIPPLPPKLMNDF